MTDDTPLQEYFSGQSQTRHFQSAFPRAPKELPHFDGLVLPYRSLEGRGFERLCFDLLRVQGLLPRFFGKPGQAQYGIDLLVVKDGDCHVYQCKNLAEEPSWPKVRDILNLFEKEWLGRPELPRPKSFTLCCPHPLDERKANQEWLAATERFKTLGVALGYWNRSYLDGVLREQPDLTASYFSRRHAEWFCDIDHWHADLFVPVRPDVAGGKLLERYESLKKKGGIFLEPDHETEFAERLETHPVILIRGTPGTGKTVTALELAGRFRDGRIRVYYLNMRFGDITIEVLLNGIRRRSALPGLFILDDCHGMEDRVARALDRLHAELNTGRLKIICISRFVPGDEEARGDYHEFTAGLEADEGVITLENTPERLDRFIASRKPAFKNLPPARRNKLVGLSGGSLYLLDELLGARGDATVIDRLDRPKQLDLFATTYFKRRVFHAPNLMKLAALAQFELAPTVADLPLTAEEENLAGDLIIQAGRPARHYFLYATAAETAFHTIALCMGKKNTEALIDFTVDCLQDYVQTQQHGDAERLASDLYSIRKGELKLWSEEDAQKLRTRFLIDEDIRRIHMDLVRETGKWPVLTIPCVMLVRVGCNDAAKAYANALFELTQEFLGKHQKHIVGFVNQAPWIIYAIKLADLEMAGKWENMITPNDWMALLYEHGSVNELFNLIRHSSQDVAQALINALNDACLDTLVKRTITTSRSIGTLNLALRELKNNDPSLLEALENKMGAHRLLHLLQANGTIFELFNLLRHSSGKAAHKLIDALDDPGLDTLVERTINTGRSIGTLNLALRELKNSDPSLLEALENKMGANCLLRLLQANGTIFELFKILEHSSPKAAHELIDALDDPDLDTLVERTITTGRSVGTLNLALRELKNSDPSLLEDLENKMGPHRLLRLLQANGTIFELFMVLRHSSGKAAQALIHTLDDPGLDTLVERTITTGRSIGTLDLALRELKNSDPSLLEALENKMGAHRLLRLLQANGTIFEFFKILEHSSHRAAQALIHALNDAGLDALIERIIATGRSIGTLDLALREFKNSDPSLLEALESKMDAHRLLRLLQASGTIIELFSILKHSSHKAAQDLTDALDDPRLDTLVERTITTGRSIGTLSMALSTLKNNDPALLEALESKMGPHRFWQLILHNGSLSFLANLSMSMSPKFAKTFVEKSIEFSNERWRPLLTAGTLRDVGIFLDQCPIFHELASQPHFVQAFTEALPEIVVSGNWDQRNLGRHLIAKKGSTPIGQLAMQAIENYLNHLTLPLELEPTLSDGANALMCFIETRPDLADHFLNQLDQFLPPSDAWLAEENACRSLNFFMFNILKQDVSTSYIHKVLDIAAKPSWQSQFPENESLYVFLFHWNWFALWFCRDGRESTRPIHSECRDALIHLITNRAAKKNLKRETQGQLMLTGFLDLLGIAPTEEMMATFDEFLHPSNRLIGDLASKTFVPGYFALRGLQAVFPKVKIFKPKIKTKLLKAAEAYGNTNPALDLLRDILTGKQSWRPELHLATHRER